MKVTSRMIGVLPDLGAWLARRATQGKSGVKVDEWIW